MGGVSAMGRRNPSDLARPVRDRMARTACACPDDDAGRVSFDEHMAVPFVKGNVVVVAEAPLEVIILGESWLCSSAIEEQNGADETAGRMPQDVFFSPYPLVAI